MTTPSTRFIAWDIPAQPDYCVKPGVEDFRFASWLIQQEPRASTEIARLANSDDLVKHVGFKMAPSRPVSQRNAPYPKPITAAYKDPRIQEEFSRWASSLTWGEHRQVYIRWANSAFNELAAPWMAHVANSCPLFKFGMLLALSLDLADAQRMLDDNPSSLMHQKVTENALQKMATLGLVLSSNNLRVTPAYEHLLQLIAKETPSQDIRPFLDLFSSFYDEAKESSHPKNSARGITYYHSALFRGAMEAYKNTLLVPQTLPLPENWMDESTQCS